MAKGQDEDLDLVEKVKRNNIELARELTKRKQRNTELNIKLQEAQYNLLDTERRLKIGITRNYDFETKMQSLIHQNQKLKMELNKRDEKLAEWELLFISTFSHATEKYSSIMRAIGVLPSATNKGSSTNAMPSEYDDETDISNGAIECDDDDDNDDVKMEDSPPPMALNPQITVIKSEQGEFSDDSDPELSSIIDQLHETFKNSVSVQNVDNPKEEAVCEKDADTIPSIIVTECNDDTANTPNKVPKRTKSDGFLQVPKLSFGKRKSDPKTAFNSKSSPKFDQQHSSTPKLKPRSTSLHKIVEISPVSKPSQNQSNSSVHDDHQTSKFLSVSTNNNDQSNDSGISKTYCSKSPLNGPNRLKTPVSSRHPITHSTDKKIELSNSAVKDRLPKRIFNNANSNRNNNVLSNSPKSPALVHSTVNQPNGMDSVKASPKDVKATVAGPEDCIARHRTTRRAAPTDLRDPVLLLKKKRKC